MRLVRGGWSRGESERTPLEVLLATGSVLSAIRIASSLGTLADAQHAALVEVQRVQADLESQRTDLVAHEADLASLDPVEPYEEARNRLLGKMEKEEARDVRELLAYPEASAGGVMTTQFVAVKVTDTVQQAIDTIRKVAADVETIYYAYAVDVHGHLVGVVSLRDLVVATAVVVMVVVVAWCPWCPSS